MLKLPGLSRRRRWPPACATTITSRSGRRRSPSTTGFRRSPASNGRRRGTGPRGVPARDGAAPGLAGSRSGGPARVCCRRGGSRAHCLRPGAAAREPRPCSAGPQIIAAGIPAVAGGVGPAWQRRSCRAESGTAPPCMRWRGRARPRRAGWPVAWSSPRAARRPPGPGTRARGRSPGSSRVPGRRPRVVPVSSGESISTTAASTAQGPAAGHFLFFRYPRKAPQRAGSYPHSTAAIHGLFTTYPQVPECQPENTTTAGAECPVLCNQLAT